MARFRNRKSDETFEVVDDRADVFYARPMAYEPVDTYPCPDCDRTFDTSQGLAAHSRTHDT